MNFLKLVVDSINESIMSGGITSVFGNTQSTANQFSGDTYAPGDSRIPKTLYGGVITRSGVLKSNKRKHKKRKRKKN